MEPKRQKRRRLVARIRRLVEAGLTNREVAARTGMSVRAIESILYRLRRKGVVIERPGIIMEDVA